MLTLQVIACIGIITGAFLLFHIQLNDFTGNIFHRLLDAPKGIREEILEETKCRKKSYFRREIEEVQAILKTTDNIRASKSFLSSCPAITSPWINFSLGTRQMGNPRRAGSLTPWQIN